MIRHLGVCNYEVISYIIVKGIFEMNPRFWQRKKILSLFLLALAGMSHLTGGQFTSLEIEQREVVEDLLKTAKIIKFEDTDEGVTKPFHLFLHKDGVDIEGCWKNPKGMQQGFLEGWQYEIAAYAMDKLLGLHMVPPTVERVFRGKRGSLQFWIKGGFSDQSRQEQNIAIPQKYIDHWIKRKYLMRAFDCLIANEDRTQQNVRYSDDWRTIIIDHSRSFRSSGKFTKQLMYGRKGIKGVKLIRQLPREFVAKIRGFDFAKIKSAAGPYLKDKEIRAVLKRKELLLKDIEEMIKESGEDKFYY